MAPRGEGRPPRIVIERTPANDVYLILDRLLPADRVAALLRDPEAYLAEHAAELRFLRQVLAERLRPSPSHREAAGRETGAAAPPAAAAVVPGDPEARPVVDFLDRGQSLLR